MAPSGVNNVMRAMMGAIRRWYDTTTAQLTNLTNNYVAKSGSTMSGTLSAPQYNLGATAFANRDGGGNTLIHDGGGGQALVLTPTGSVYRADTHLFETEAGVDIVSLGAAGMSVAATLNVTAGVNVAGTVNAISVSATGAVTAGSVSASSVSTTGAVSAGNVSASLYNLTGTTLASRRGAGGETLIHDAGGAFALVAGGDRERLPSRHPFVRDGCWHGHRFGSAPPG